MSPAQDVSVIVFPDVLNFLFSKFDLKAREYFYPFLPIFSVTCKSPLGFLILSQLANCCSPRLHYVHVLSQSLDFSCLLSWMTQTSSQHHLAAAPLDVAPNQTGPTLLLQSLPVYRICHQIYVYVNCKHCLFCIS